MDAITESLARQRVAQDAHRGRRTTGVRPKGTTRHTLASSLRRFADKIDG